MGFMRFLRFLAVAALTLLAVSPSPVRAAFTVITGTGSVTVSNNVATSGTGLISSTNFLSWSVTGPDGADVGGITNTISGLTTSSGTPIAAVYLVSNGTNATLPGTPATLPNTPVSNLQRRNSQFPSYSGDFTPGEPPL